MKSEVQEMLLRERLPLQIGSAQRTHPGNQAFVQNYTAKYGMEPSVWAAQPYAAVYILAEAIKNAQSTDSKAIAAALAEIKDFDTILGKFSFDANGDAIYDPGRLDR